MQSGRSIWQRIGDLAFPGGSMIVGGWLLIHGFSNYQVAVTFKDKALLTTGIITETTTQSNLASSGLSAAPPSYVSTIQFKTEKGEAAQFKAHDICYEGFRLNSCDGKDVQVLYASDNPQLAMVKGGSSPMDKVKQAIGLGLFMLLGGIMISISELKKYGGWFRSEQHR